MTLDSGPLIGVVFGYMLTMFLLAWSADRKLISSAIIEHPMVYTLSLGVILSAFSLFGTVSLAAILGYGHLAYFIGPALLFMASPALLRPLRRICTENRLSSLADLFTFRYRSAWTGGLVTVLLTLGALPLMAVQIKVISAISLLMLPESSAHGLRVFLPPAVCLVLIAFTVMFGSRHLESTETHRGLVLALALQNLIKLTAVFALGATVIIQVFGGFDGLQSWIAQNPETASQLRPEIDPSTTNYLIAIFASAALCLPHGFHMLFAENPTRRAQRTSYWGFPLMLLLMAIPIFPILWAATKLELDIDFYVSLVLPMTLEQPWLAILIFLAGLSATTGAVAVMALALASMWLNHVILPNYQPKTNDIYRWLLTTRRLLIGSLILLGLVVHYVMPLIDYEIGLGFISLIACMQFVPGLMALLFWPGANRVGLLAGLIAAFVLCTLTILVNIINLYVPSTDILPLLDLRHEDGWMRVAGLSLLANFVTLILVSLSTPMREDERNAAQVCTNRGNVHHRRSMQVHDIAEMRARLAAQIGHTMANREIGRVLQELDVLWDERRPSILRRVRTQLELNLAGVLGPAVARTTVNRALPFIAGEANMDSEDIAQAEERIEQFQQNLTGLAADVDNLRRHHRELLERLPLGLSTVSSDHEIVTCNALMADLLEVKQSEILGARLADLRAPWNTLLSEFLDSGQQQRRKLAAKLDGVQRWFNISRADSTTERDEIAIIVEDITENQRLENDLSHQERLASIGRLAAGVAHEIGNPVTGIACLAQNLKYDTDQPEALETADQIIQQTQRIDAIVKSLMNFAHGNNSDNKSEMTPVSLQQCVNDAIRLLSLDRDAVPVNYINRVPKSVAVVADAPKLSQVFINLLTNARDASEAGGKIEVTAKETDTGVAIEVTDWGEGIPEDNMSSLFEPFFTTKDIGQGTGLGLPLVYGIIEELDGDIRFESPAHPPSEEETEHSRPPGTRVRITLPSAVCLMRVDSI